VAEPRITRGAGHELALAAVSAKAEQQLTPADWARWSSLRCPARYEIAPQAEEWEPVLGFGGSSLFSAIDEQRRLWIDVEWRSEDDSAGEYRLKVEHAPWERTARGRRRKEVSLDFGAARVVHEFRTHSRVELVRELEAALAGRSEWLEHS
jgi:hypothetical protein